MEMVVEMVDIVCDDGGGGDADDDDDDDDDEGTLKGAHVVVVNSC